MRIEVLGPVRLRDDGGARVEVPERKVRALLAALVAADGRTVSADTLLDQVWGRALPAHPARVLQSKLSQVRTLLGSAARNGRAALVREPGGYRLETAPHEAEGAVPAVRTDADELRRRVTRAQAATEPDERLSLLSGVQDLWRGRPYGEFADELWASADTAALEEMRLRAVELQAGALLETGRPEPAYAVVQPLLHHHPTREPLIRAAMHTCYLTGRYPESLRLYARLRTHLADELGADPGAASRELHERILRQDPQLGPAPGAEARPRASPAPPAPATVGGKRGNLPDHGCALIGRETESAELVDLLRGRRLVTVLGIGGVGKTRLATAAAAGAVRAPHEGDDAAHGVSREGAVGPGSAWWADLTCLAEGEGTASVTDLLVALLKLPTACGDHEELLSRVAAALDKRRALLVLDNCEHLVEPVSVFTAELLSRTEHVRVLATSREPLGLAQEQRFPLTPLAVDGTGPAGWPAAEDGHGNAAQRNRGPAVALFLARTRAVAPQLRLSDRELDTVTELCRRLDGLPLALELAAGRMNTLAPQDLLERITDRLDLLAHPGRGAPRRRRTLRGMLDWSWELLDDAERALLRRLAVHPASWPLETVEAVCADRGTDPACGPMPPEAAEAGGRAEQSGAVLRRAEVLPVLARLVDHSLVSTVRIESGGGTAVRYRLLETVAAYAGEKLEGSGERPQIAAAHISHHRGMAERARGLLFGPRARDRIHRLDQELVHLNHAHAEALRSGEGADAVALVLSTFWYRWMTGRVGGLVRMLRATLDCPGPRDNAYRQVAVLAARVDESPDTGMSRRWYEEITGVLAAFGHGPEAVRARMQVQWFVATVLISSPEHRRAGDRLAEEAIAFLVADGDLQGAAFAAAHRDFFWLDHWDVAPRGLPGGRNAETVLRECGDGYGLILLLSVLHMQAENEGRTAAAERITEEALALAVGLDLEGEAAYWYPVRALNSLRAGDVEAAEQAIGAGLALTGSVAFWFGEVFAGAARAACVRARGDTVRAAQIFGSFSAAEQQHSARWVSRVLGPGTLPTPDELGRARSAGAP